jgi:WD40 repeat protein
VVARHLQTTTGSAADAQFRVDLVPVDGAPPRRSVPVGRQGDYRIGDWHPSGRAYVTGNLDGEVLTIPRAGRIAALATVPDAVVSVEHTPDGEHLVVADEAGRVRRLDAASGRRTGVPVRLDGLGTDLAVSPDGRHAFLLVSRPPGGPQEYGIADSWVLVDLVDGHVAREGRLPDAGGDYNWDTADFDPADPDRVAVFGLEGVLVLDLTTGEPVNALVTGHSDAAEVGGYTADGSRILSGGAIDGRVAVWDREGALRDVALIEPDTNVTTSMLPDGHTVLAVTDTGFYQWDTRIGPALEAACRAAGRSMTAVEWRTNVGEEIPYRETCP